VFILKGVKVICFDTLLQVLILKDLHCMATARVRPGKTPFRRVAFPGGESKNASRDAGVTMLRRWHYYAKNVVLSKLYDTRRVTGYKGKRIRGSVNMFL
jgi:hypothetical protein